MKRLSPALPLALAVLLPVTGCGATVTPPSSLTVYAGHGISVGYPKSWRRAAGAPMVMPAAVFEATAPTSTAQARTTGAFDVTADQARPNVSFDEAVTFFVQGSRTQDGFRLLGERPLKLSSASGTEVEQEYVMASLRIRQVDWLVEPAEAPIVYIRMQFLADHYNAALVRDVRASIRVRQASA